MLSNKLFGIKEQVAAEKAIKDAGLWDAVNNLYLYFTKNQNDVSEYLLNLKKDGNVNEFEKFFSYHESSRVLWNSPSYDELIVPIVKYFYKRKFESGTSLKSWILGREIPTGLLKFGSDEVRKRDKDDIYDIWHLVREIIGEDSYRQGKEFRFVFLEEGTWFLSSGVNAFIPEKLYPNLKENLVDYYGKEVLFDYVTDIVEGSEKPANMQELQDLRDLFNAKNPNNKIDNLDSQLLLNNFHVAAQASAQTDSEYPIFHEIKIKGENYSVPSLAFFIALNSLQTLKPVSVYHSPLHLILESPNGAFSIVNVQTTGIAYANLTLGMFKSGLTIREAERIDLTSPITIDIPTDLLSRKPKLKDILDKQRLLTENVYDGLLSLTQEYIGSYTKKVVTPKGEFVQGVLSIENENDLNYVYEVDEIFWRYNGDITIEELLAFFITKGADRNYQLLCLKVLGIDYMLHFNELVDALIERKFLMIEDIEVDEDTRELKELTYTYLYLYASGNIYQKRKRLEQNQKHILSYYGEELGLKIIAAQSEILDDHLPVQCSLLTAEKDKQLELDWNNAIFWDDFPDLSTKAGDKKNIRKLFEDYLPKQPKIGGITDEMIKDGYLYPTTRTQFIEKHILPKWKHKGKLLKISSPSLVSILDALFPKQRPQRKVKKRGKVILVPGKPRMKEFSPQEQREGKIVYKAIIAKYYNGMSVIKVEGNRIFNMLLRNELSAASQQVVVQLWNEKFNHYKAPVSSKVPVFMRLARFFGTDNKLFALNEIQLEGIKFSIARDNNALLAHEVGLGKTIMSLGLVSHLFETGTLNRIMIITPKAVYHKFIREAKGEGNFRGAIPHINLVELDNAKPDKFYPDIHKVTKEILRYKLKKYTKDEIKVYDMYKAFLDDINAQIDRLPNRRLDVDPKYVDMIRETLTQKYIPNYTTYPFLLGMFKDIERELNANLQEIADKIKLVQEKYRKEGNEMPKSEEEPIRIRYGKIFSKETIDSLNAMKNKILDELGEYQEYVMKPKTIVMATHVALTELRPNEDAMTEAIKIIDDADTYEESRGVSKEWKRIVGNQAISVDKLKIDGIILDEAHNFNELISHIRSRYVREAGRKHEWKYEKLPIGAGDSVGRHIFRYWYKIVEPDNRKMAILGITRQVKSKVLLSATPFTEGPLHAVSIMNMVNRKKLVEMGFGSAYNFFENFIFELWKIDTKLETGKTGLFAVVDRYRNNAALCNFMAAFSDFKVGNDEINQLRPEKFIIPDEDQKLNNINSFIPNTPVQEILKERISDFVNMKIIGTDARGNAIIFGKEHICQIEDDIEVDTTQADNEDTNEQDAEALIVNENAGKRFLKEARIFQARSMQEKMNISPYFMECSAEFVKRLPKGANLPSLNDVIKDKDGNPVMFGEIKDASGRIIKTGSPRSIAPKYFVEHSPKLLYTVECIKSVLETHEENSEIPSGQIIYLNIGKKFKYEGETYSAYDLFREYIAFYRPDIGLSLDEVKYIHGGSSDDEIEEIMRDFNNGKIKVLIGSAKIKEGIDLQRNTSVMYMVSPSYNPTDAIQLEGRGWRQGNRWKNIRIVYVLSYDSIDVFVYSKVKNKITSVKGIMRAGRCDFNETQIFSFDPGEVQMALTTDADEQSKLWWQREEFMIRRQMDTLNTERNLLMLVKRDYKKVKPQFEEFIGQLNLLSKTLEKVKLRDLKEKIIAELRLTEREKTREQLAEEADQLIAAGKYQMIYVHKDFTMDMNHSDFHDRMDYIRTNYRIAEQYRGERSRKETPAELEMPFEDKTKQQIYWETLIEAGFDKYRGFKETTEKFLRGSNNDIVLSAYNAQVVSSDKQFADIEDILESIEKKINAITKRINNKDKEISTQKVIYQKKVEEMKKAGAFNVENQIQAFASTNYLLVARNP